MKHVVLALLLLSALPASGSTFFPLVPGAAWTLQGDGGDGTWNYFMGGTQLWHGAFCSPRVEWLTAGVGGTTYWSEDDAGRILLHGLQYQASEFGEFYFDPPAVYLDPTLQPGDVTTSTVSVYEVLDVGDLYHGLFTIELHCVSREPVTTPLGTFTAITVQPAWPGSPAWPWCYGSDGVFSYGWGVGPVHLASVRFPETDWVLVALQGLDLTVTPLPAAECSLVAAPNPFNPATTLRFALAAAGPTRLEVFDLAGRRIATLCDGDLAAGPHAITWQPENLGSGLYLARLTTTTGTASAGTTTARLTLLE